MNSVARPAHGHGADFNTRNSLLALGIPTDAPWVRLRSEPFVTGRETALITVDGAVCQTFEWAPDPEQRDAWNGHALEIIGALHAGTPDPRFAPLVGEYGPFWLLTDADGAVRYVRIWHYRVLVSGTPLSVVLTIGHGRGQQRRGSLEGLHLAHKPADTRRAAAAEALLWRLADSRQLTAVEAQRRLDLAVDTVLSWESAPSTLTRRHLGDALGCTEPSVSSYIARSGTAWSMSALKRRYAARFGQIPEIGQ